MENVSNKSSLSNARGSLGEMVRVYGSLGVFARSNLVIVWIGLLLLVWFYNPIKALPFPGEVLQAFGRMWSAEGGQGLLYNVYVTLKLNQDEVYTFTDVAGISGLVDNLLTNLRVSEEFRSAYEDVLSAEAGIGVADRLLEGGDDSAMIETPELETRPLGQSERIQRSK